MALPEIVPQLRRRRVLRFASPENSLLRGSEIFVSPSNLPCLVADFLQGRTHPVHEVPLQNDLLAVKCSSSSQ